MLEGQETPSQSHKVRGDEEGMMRWKMLLRCRAYEGLWLLQAIEAMTAQADIEEWSRVEGLGVW